MAFKKVVWRKSVVYFRLTGSIPVPGKKIFFIDMKIYCNLLSKKNLNKLVYIFGWINKIRNHGNIIFLDIRDKTGFIQIILKNINKKKFSIFLKLESCIFLKGFLVLRDVLFYNFFLFNGNLEIYCYNFFIINLSSYLNFDINNYLLTDFVNLRNRCIILRSNYMQNNLKFKYNFVKYIRNFLNKEFFIDIETPFLTRNNSEGARNFLVIYRFNKLKFFALTQSPQIFKQFLMISCLDKYYQIVKCFRDEDFRKNRQSEFTQIDFEISFYKNYDIIYFFLNLIIFLFKIFMSYNLFNFFFIEYKKSVKYFLSDKPDLRFKLIYYNFLNFYKFKYFLINFNYKFVVINIMNFNYVFGNNFKNFYFFINKNFFFINILFFINLKKYYFIFYNSNFLNNIKFFFEINIFFNNFNYKNFFIIININNKLINLFISYIYILCFSKFSFFNNYFNYNFLPIWVFNFPLFEYNIILKKYNYIHNPFSSPLNFDNFYLDFFILNCYSKSYDIIINGSELGGGSIRNNKIYIQKRIFFILICNFDFFLKFLKFGTPIHGGIALGLERFLILFLFSKSIKDVIAFPKTQKGFCLSTNAPNIL